MRGDSCEHTDLWDYIDALREDLSTAFGRIADLEEKVFEHEQAVPHAEAKS